MANVKQFGAAGDGRQDDAPAIQAALDQGGEVTIPAGEYRLGQTLLIGSQTRVLAAPEAIMRLAEGAGRHARTFLITNRNRGNGNHDIHLSGGVWDGHAAANPRGEDGDLDGYTGVAINFVRVRGLTVSDLTVRDPESFSIRLGEVTDFRIANILLDHQVIRPNQDGVHLGGYCHRGEVRGIRAVTPLTPNDDMVALNADDDVERVLNLGMRRGPITDITVADIDAEDAYTFVRLLSVDQPIERIRISGLRGGCRMLGLNLNEWRFPAGSGAIRDVTVRDCRLRKTRVTPGCDSLIDLALKVDELAIEGLVVEPGDPAARTLTIRNDGKWRAVLAGLTKTQVAELTGASTGVVVRAGAAPGSVTVAGVPDGRLVLPGGSLPSLRLYDG